MHQIACSQAFIALSAIQTFLIYPHLSLKHVKTVVYIYEKKCFIKELSLGPPVLYTTCL